MPSTPGTIDREEKLRLDDRDREQKDITCVLVSVNDIGGCYCYYYWIHWIGSGNDSEMNVGANKCVHCVRELRGGVGRLHARLQRQNEQNMESKWTEIRELITGYGFVRARQGQTTSVFDLDRWWRLTSKGD